MATVGKFEELDIWIMARSQANELFLLYTATSFAKDFELKNQLSRSTGSVMDNIAEGFERSGNKEFIHFLIIAKGSNGEVRSQFHRALDRHHIELACFDSLIQKNEMISKKIISLIKYLKGSDRKGFRFD